MNTASTRLKIGCVDNSGPNTLLSFLQNTGDGATSIDIAAAFLTSSGVDAILYLLKKTARKGLVRVLTGLYQGFTEPDALRKLFRAQVETEGRLSVSISRDAHFHWKCYFVKRTKNANLVIGSSNLTGDGLRQTGEFNVVLTVAIDSNPFRDVTKHFDNQWIRKASPLTEAILLKYERWRKISVGMPSRPSVPIRNILGRSPSPQRKEESDTRRFWRTGICGHLSEDAEIVLKDTTNWERKSFFYFSTWNRSFAEGDQVVLFDMAHKTIQIVEIMETTETPVMTPDGNHFAAYRTVRGVPERRLVVSRWQFIKKANLLKRRSDALSTRKLSQATFDRYVENIKSRVPSKS
jgi:HKD family nuclease